MTRQMADDEVLRVREQSGPEVGDYVLATKYGDGDPADRWAVGFYDGHRDGRHYVNDAAGQSIHAGGYRRVGVIGKAHGTWLLENARWLESAPPGFSLWGDRSHRQALAALQAERDALRAEVDRLLLSAHILEGRRAPSERAAEDAVRFLLDTAPQERAERAESALEALRGQVAEVVAAHTGDNIDGCAMTDEQVSRLAALLAIKERMG